MVGALSIVEAVCKLWNMYLVPWPWWFIGFLVMCFLFLVAPPPFSPLEQMVFAGVAGGFLAGIDSLSFDPLMGNEEEGTETSHEMGNEAGNEEAGQQDEQSGSQ